MADRIGQQIGNYRITRLIGRGGFADVYLGEHIYLKSQAALKILRTSLSDKDVQRFFTEAQTLVRLRHPHIVRVLDFAVEQGTPVLIMDYAPGGIIREIYPAGSPLPLKVVVAYVRQIASALQYAHNHNVIHRDVKPENILLGPEQELLLSDFGLSLLTPSSNLLSTQEMAGTIPYMAPEQLHGKPVFASDQY
ncbi:MAG: serine/threonine protein kinase, partial [Chloroflexi bacterium]|nr:serine/threonine protein kinase [Chloroflexota bacterium]